MTKFKPKEKLQRVTVSVNMPIELKERLGCAAKKCNSNKHKLLIEMIEHCLEEMDVK